MFTVTAYAEIKDVSYKVTVEGENVSVVEDNLTSDTDCSDLYVNVIKDTNGQQTTIYSGALGDYADGAFTDVDFSEINFMVIFDWNTMEDEAIYIIPTESEYASAPISMTSSNEVINNYTLENLDSGLNTDINIIYNNEFYEGALIHNNTLNVFMTISNSGVARNLVCYLAEYDSTGKLLGLTANNTIPVPANESVTANLTKTFSNSNTTGTVYITKGQYLPQSVYRTVELYDADGELQQKKKNYMSVSSSGSEMSFSMPSGYACGTDGSYIVLSLYEREDEQQLLSRITIKPSYFDLSSFN